MRSYCLQKLRQKNCGPLFRQTVLRAPCKTILACTDGLCDVAFVCRKTYSPFADWRSIVPLRIFPKCARS